MGRQTGMDQFWGYPRKHGRVGTRNYLAVIPTVFCANEVAGKIAQRFKAARTLLHHQGCAQLKPDVERVTRTLIALGSHPNVGAVLLVGLGCESVSLAEVYSGIKRQGQRIEQISIQKLGGMQKTVQKGIELARKMEEGLARMERKSFPVSRLVMGIKCGSSDASSGLVSNPAVGAASDLLLSKGGSIVFGETTEFIGAEHLLARRAINQGVAARILEIVERMENRVKATGVDMRGGQPTPGNMQGGITTIEEKSLGAICKSGAQPIDGVLEYGETLSQRGLYIVDSPGKEAEILTGLTAAGANIIVFSTGGGAPQGYPLVPVIKLGGNPEKCRFMKEHIDIDASSVLQGKMTVEQVATKVFSFLQAVGSGQRVKAEILGYDQTVEIYTTGPII
jgi:altronate dehydratase large subunit